MDFRFYSVKSKHLSKAQHPVAMEEALNINDFGSNDANGEILKTNNVIQSHKCNQCNFASSQGGHLRRHLKTHSGEKSNKCNQCDYASSHAGDLGRHLKTHSGEKSNKCNQCDYAIRGDIWEPSGENKKMQPMRLCILWGKRFEETFENT